MALKGLQREAVTIDINRALEEASVLLEKAERLKDESVAYTREAITMIKTAHHLERVLLTDNEQENIPKTPIH